MDKKIKYNSCSIDTWDGKTYWHKGFETLDEVYAHLKRYIHKECDVIIYDISERKEHGIKFVGIIKRYSNRKETNELLAL